MIRYNKKTHVYYLETPNTLYALRTVRGERPEHLFFGRIGTRPSKFPRPCYTKYSFRNYEVGRPMYTSPEILFAEISGYGSGDYRTESVRLAAADGNAYTDLRLVSHRVYAGMTHPTGLPTVRRAEEAETLELTLKDLHSGVRVLLSYTLLPDSDVILRNTRFENKGRRPVRLQKGASLALDISVGEYDLISLPGDYYHERRVDRAPIRQGIQVMTSRRGASSHQMNPFFAVAARDTDENKGDVYAFNTIYSGSFRNEVECDPSGNLRVLCSMGDESFSWLLGRGEHFDLPTAVMLYSEAGLGTMRRRMHDFVRGHILPPHKMGRAPIVLNTWEGTHFAVNEKCLLDYADAARGRGIELLVMDDGWFGKRLHDRAALGDWYANPDKFPNGLAHLIDEVHARGLSFGIWVEPEMISPDSDLYRAHPEYALRVPGIEPLRSRHQLVLDLGNPEVLDYLKRTYTETFRGCQIDYFKWDMNRHMSDVYSAVLPAARQGEAAHRYMLGLYELLAWWRRTFPSAMLETCSGGGGRFDLGMLAFGETIWASDNTDPIDRILIQRGTLLAYPAAGMSCHIANRGGVCEGNARTLRFRYAVAAVGSFGYEFNLAKCSEELKDSITRLSAEYLSYARLLTNGDYYELVAPRADADARTYRSKNGPLHPRADRYAYVFAAKDGSEFLLTALQGVGSVETFTLSVPSADPTATYLDRLSGKKYEGRVLCKGFPVATDGEDEWSFMLHLTKCAPNEV